MVNYTKPELEVTEFEIVDVLTLSAFQTGDSISTGDSGNWDGGSWY